MTDEDIRLVEGTATVKHPMKIRRVRITVRKAHLPFSHIHCQSRFQYVSASLPLWKAMMASQSRIIALCGLSLGQSM